MTTSYTTMYVNAQQAAMMRAEAGDQDLSEWATAWYRENMGIAGPVKVIEIAQHWRTSDDPDS